MAHCSRHTVRDVLQAAKEQGISWPLSDDVANADLEQLLFPNRHKASSQYAEPDYPYIHRELARSGVTLTLLWEEYCAKCQEAGQRPYMSTQFGERYRRWARITKATMRIQHKPGDAMQVDWAGQTAALVDTDTGERLDAYLFVAVLPYSGYAYTEAFLDMKQEAWITGHVNAYRYFGGVTRILTIESSGIALAVAAGIAMHVPTVFAKKHRSANMPKSVYTAPVYSFTHHETYEIAVAREYLPAGEKVLIVDDFLANGNAVRGLMHIIKEAEAELVGCAIAIEKGFQEAGDQLRKEGVRIDSLAIIDAMTDESVTFRAQ